MSDQGKARRNSEAQMTKNNQNNVHFSHPRSLPSTRQGTELSKATWQEDVAEIRHALRIQEDSEMNYVYKLCITHRSLLSSLKSQYVFTF